MVITSQRAVVRIPDIVGLPLRKARLVLEHAGLRLGALVFQESYEARDTVLTQKPQRGQMAYAGDDVTVSISRESYVRWLPSIYHRNDDRGRNFVREFLWIVQHLFSSIEEQLDVVHELFDPYEAPSEFLPWLASWSAMVLDEDWPVEKKRRLIRNAVQLYRIRGTVRGLKLFIALFTGHEPEVLENQWPFRGWRIGVSSEIGVDTVVLPPVNLAHAFVVEMPVGYQDVSTESIIRIHEIIQMEKPANTQYYLRFAVEEREDELREFFVIGARSGIGIGAEVTRPITSEAEYEAAQKEQAEKEAEGAGPRTRQLQAARLAEGEDDGFSAPPRRRPIKTGAPRADQAPLEGREPRSREAGFGASARQFEAVSMTRAMQGVGPEAAPAPSEGDAGKTIATTAVGPDTITTEAVSPEVRKSPAAQKPGEKKTEPSADQTRVDEPDSGRKPASRPGQDKPKKK